MTDKISVLAAEDNPALAHILDFTLQQANWNVTVARDGDSAWKLAQSQRFDVLVTDQEMPGLTGVELCQRVRALPQYQDIPIVMVTAREVDLDVAGLQRQLGIAAVLAKPYSPSHLIKTIEELTAATA